MSNSILKIIAKPDALKQEIEESCFNASVHDFILSLYLILTPTFIIEPNFLPETDHDDRMTTVCRLKVVKEIKKMLKFYLKMQDSDLWKTKKMLKYSYAK